jgi:hypothetical protein
MAETAAAWRGMSGESGGEAVGVPGALTGAMEHCVRESFGWLIRLN